jgi:hypothetical protein
MKTTYLIVSLIFLGFSGYTQTIEKYSIDSGGNSFENGDISVLYTIGEVHVQELSTETVSVSEGFINSDMKIKINPKLFLQGPSINPVSAGLMNDNLRQNTLIPNTSPYADSTTCDVSVFSVTGDNAIVDWVWVELRTAVDNQKLVNGKSALLQRDGDVVGLDGVSNVIMEAAPTNYYVVVNHRNHLGAMSSSALSLNNTTPTVVDFTDNVFTTYGNYARVLLDNGSLALWSGDSNAMNRIRFLGADSSITVIKDQVLGDPNNGFGSITYASLGYFNTDLDLNGASKYTGSESDSNIVRDNVLSHPANGFGSPTYTIQETVPPNN